MYLFFFDDHVKVFFLLSLNEKGIDSKDVEAQKGGGGALWDGMGKNEQFQLNM